MTIFGWNFTDRLRTGRHYRKNATSNQGGREGVTWPTFENLGLPICRERL